MKKLLAILLASILALTVVPFSFLSASAETDSQGLTFVFTEGFYYDYYMLTSCPTTATSVVIPETFGGYPVAEIKSDCFAACNLLTSINIPASVTRIQQAAIASCDALTTLTVDAENTVYYSEGNCILEKESKKIVVGCKNSTIPTDAEVTTIGPYAFYRCSGIKKIVAQPSDEAGAFYIPANITTIENEAFCLCDNLVSAEFSDSVTHIKNYAFQFCEALISVDFGDGLTSIGNYCFNNCSALPEVLIPASVSNIGRYAFDDCESLTDIYFESDELPAEVGTEWYNSASVELHFGQDNVDSIIVNGDKLVIDSYTVSDNGEWIPDWADVTDDDGKKLIDGTKNTGALTPAMSGWYFPVNSYANGGSIEFVLALEELSNVTDVVAYFYNYYPDYYTSADEITVEYSLDGTNYTSVSVSAVKASLAASDYPNFAWVLTLDNAVTAKYIKLTVNGAADSLILTDEIELYGSKADYLLGDVNASGEVDSADYLLVKRHCFETYKLEGEEFVRADVQNNGVLDSSDYVILKRLCFGTYKA